jgi:hypothetical protein
MPANDMAELTKGARSTDGLGRPRARLDFGLVFVGPRGAPELEDGRGEGRRYRSRRGLGQDRDDRYVKRSESGNTEAPSR